MTGDQASQPAPEEVTDHAAQLRAVAHQVATLFAGEPRVTIDHRYDANLFGQLPTTPRRYGWEYNLRLAAPPDAADVLRAQVVPDLVGAGWRATDRSSERELAYQFSRNGFNLGVHVARAGGGDVVIGGSTPPVPASD